MALNTFERHQVGRKRHVEWPVPKHVENSLRGIRYAARHGYDSIDLDMLPDGILTERVKHPAPMTFADIAGHLRGDHWPDPFRHDGFRDPKGLLGPGDHITTLTPPEIDRLVAGHWPRRYRIPRVEAELALCARLRTHAGVPLKALLEPKHSPVWMRPEVWNYLAWVCEEHDTHVAVYSLMHECLPVAREAGFNAWPI